MFFPPLFHIEMIRTKRYVYLPPASIKVLIYAARRHLNLSSRGLNPFVESQKIHLLYKCEYRYKKSSSFKFVGCFVAIRFLIVLGQQNNSSVRQQQQHCKDICAFWPESKNQSQQQRLLAVCVECWARLFYSGLVNL